MKPSVVGGGLAGCEAAWALAERGVAVDLFEMRPSVTTPAHQTDRLAEIAARDERLSALNLNEDSLRQILTRLKVTNKARAKEVVALNNAQLRQAAGLGTFGVAS